MTRTTSPGTRHFIGPLTPAQQCRRLRNRRNWHRIETIAYTFNVTATEAMKMDTDDRKYGTGRETRLSDYLCS